MKELSPHPSPQDIYLMSIVDELSKKYLDVSVLRGSQVFTFIYSDKVTKQRHELKETRQVIDHHQKKNTFPLSIKEILYICNL
jgi:hypothetical protein